MKIKLDEGAKAPERAHPTDAGLDLFANEARVIPMHQHRVIRTGVHIQLPPGTAGLIVSKSGLNCKHGITSTGLIDEGYTGEIMVSMINNGPDVFRVNQGDKISQLVVIPVRYEPVEIVDEISGGERGDNGFGSTGR